MCEYEITFPYDSNLTISIHDSSLLGGRTEIGRTEIDLENRYYTKCYAHCGLAKRYDTKGYNMWRDAFTPCEILNKLCKQFGLERPIYNDDCLIITRPKLNNSMSKEGRDLLYKNKPVENNIADAAKTGSLVKLPSVEEQSPKDIKQQLALDALNDWKNITGVSEFFLVILNN